MAAQQSSGELRQARTGKFGRPLQTYEPEKGGTLRKDRHDINRAAYLACAWALIFAAMSFYWALGGTMGSETQGAAIKELARAREPWFVAVLWITGVAKALAGLCALALARPWIGYVPHRLALLGGWGAGVGLSVYGGIPLVVNGLMLAGLVRVGGEVDWTAIRWHFLLWDPWWLLGGMLFAAATWNYQRRSRRIL